MEAKQSHPAGSTATITNSTTVTIQRSQLVSLTSITTSLIGIAITDGRTHGQMTSILLGLAHLIDYNLFRKRLELINDIRAILRKRRGGGGKEAYEVVSRSLEYHDW